MKPTLFPTLVEVLELHLVLIDRFGGSPGIRDKGLLESALLRPQTGYYETLSLQAASLLQSLIRNHAFIDGNKRVAFATAAIFLRMNGYSLKVEGSKAESFLVKNVIQKQASLEEIATWLEKGMVRA